MNKKNISPNPQKPVERQPNGKLPSALAELTEAALTEDGRTRPASTDLFGISACFSYGGQSACSYDGDEE